MPRSSCAGCGRVFSSLTAFDDHQSEGTREECCTLPEAECRESATGVVCHDPRFDEARFKPSERAAGVWTGAGSAPVEKFRGREA